MNSYQKIHHIHNDFTNRLLPFDKENQFPEDKLLDELPSETTEQRGFLLTFFCSLDYNRDAFNLAQNIVEFYTREDDAPYSFSAFVETYTQEDLEQIFDEIGFRYPSRDARGISHNFKLFTENYETVENMILDVDSSATEFVDRLSDDDFLYLKGVKLAPFYTRLVSKFVKDMDGLWELNIPVDVHIRRLSKDLFEENAKEMSDDKIRETWKEVGDELNMSPAVVDGALWIIGNNWDSWGADYWKSPNSDSWISS